VSVFWLVGTSCSEREKVSTTPLVAISCNETRSANRRPWKANLDRKCNRSRATA